MSINLPKGVEAKCDNEGCPNVVEIPIRYIKSAFNKANLMKKLRRMGWYVSEKYGATICPECRDKMGIRRKEITNSEEFTHIGCGGIAEFDSFGNFKCKKCGLVSKDTKLLDIGG